MAKEISTELDSRTDYVYIAELDAWIPISAEVQSDDVIFSDGESLTTKIESLNDSVDYLKDYGADVKKKVASAVSHLTTFTSPDATWDEIFYNVENAIQYLIGANCYSGNSTDYYLKITKTGTYQIDCYGAQSSNKAGDHVSGQINLIVGDVLTITVSLVNASSYSQVIVNDDIIISAKGGELGATVIDSNFENVNIHETSNYDGAFVKIQLLS